MIFDLQEHTHRRRNPLTGEWLLVSPHRAKRPWQGKQESVARAGRLEYDPSCYLCPGNTRASGDTNPAYTDVYVFTNDFASLIPDVPGNDPGEDTDLLRAESERGTCRVVCFSPRHDLTLSGLPGESITKVVRAWQDEYRTLGAVDYINYVQIFENKGAVMGCSNPHPHGQIWANETVPVLPALETGKQSEYLAEHGRCLLCSYLDIELSSAERIVFENDTWVCLVPFWAVWPFETMILPKRHLDSLLSITDTEVAGLSDAIGRLSRRYDNLFATEFPYSMGIHQSPTQGSPAGDSSETVSVHDAWHMHLHYYPPLLRSATVKKFMVGYEMLAMPQRDITAELSAKRLRESAET